MEHVGDGAAWRDRVDRDLLVPRVFREDADERLDGRLGARVQRVLGHAEFLGRVGRHEDDAAAGVEMAVRFAGDEELRTRVDAEDTIEFFLSMARPLVFPNAAAPASLASSRSMGNAYLGHIAHVPKTHDPGVAAHDVEPAEMPHRIGHQRGRLRHLADVGLEGDRVGPQALDLRHDFLRRFPRVGVVDDHLGAAAAEVDGHGGADATARAGDEGDFAIEAVGDVRGGHWVRAGGRIVLRSEE